MLIPVRTILAGILFLAAWSYAGAATISGKVVGVSDGDTITIVDSRKKQHRIRFYGIDCPETGQPFGSNAKTFTSRSCFGKQVTVTVKDTDSYGRTVGVITVDRTNLNLALVNEGLAWWYRRYAPRDRNLQAAELQAQRKKKGIWSQSNPVAPWDWRQQGNRSSASSKRSATKALGYWLTKSSNKRHNSNCKYFRKTRGQPCTKSEGVACRICGG